MFFTLLLQVYAIMYWFGMYGIGMKVIWMVSESLKTHIYFSNFPKQMTIGLSIYSWPLHEPFKDNVNSIQLPFGT